MCTARRVLSSAFEVEDRDPRQSAIVLPSQDTTHPLDHLSSRLRRRHDDGKICGGNIDAFVEHARSDDRLKAPRAESLEDGASLV